MPEYDDLPRPQDATADEPVTDADQAEPPTPQGRTAEGTPLDADGEAHDDDAPSDG